MVNVYFKWMHISQFKWLIDVFNYSNSGDKERVKLREEILVGLVQFKLEHYSIIGS